MGYVRSNAVPHSGSRAEGSQTPRIKIATQIDNPTPSKIASTESWGDKIRFCEIVVVLVARLPAILVCAEPVERLPGPYPTLIPSPCQCRPPSEVRLPKNKKSKRMKSCSVRWSATMEQSVLRSPVTVLKSAGLVGQFQPMSPAIKSCIQSCRSKRRNNGV